MGWAPTILLTGPLIYLTFALALGFTVLKPLLDKAPLGYLGHHLFNIVILRNSRTIFPALQQSDFKVATRSQVRAVHRRTHWQTVRFVFILLALSIHSALWSEGCTGVMDSTRVDDFVMAFTKLHDKEPRLISESTQTSQTCSPKGFHTRIYMVPWQTHVCCSAWYSDVNTIHYH